MGYTGVGMRPVVGRECLQFTVLLLSGALLCTPESLEARKDGYYDIDLVVDESSIGLHSATFWFKNIYLNISIGSHDYYCLQAVRRWHDFKPYCDALMLANREQEWVHVTYDELDWWDKDYHARVSLCSTHSSQYLYCDAQTDDPHMLARSPVISFRTHAPEDGTQPTQQGSSQTVTIALGVTIIIVLCVVAALNICLYRKIRRMETENKNSKIDGSASNYNLGYCADSNTEDEELLGRDAAECSYWTEPDRPSVAIST